MRKITKIAIILAVILALVGVFCMMSAFAMGFTWDELSTIFI